MDEEKSSGFKVIDKRRFTQDGIKNEDAVPKEQASRQEAVAAAPINSETESNISAAPQSIRSDANVNGQLGDFEIDFSSFVVSMATQALALMGVVQHPDLEGTPINLEAAKQTIDVLGMLEVKTKGNLSKEEESMLKEILTSLRLAYVDKSKG